MASGRRMFLGFGKLFVKNPTFSPCLCAIECIVGKRSIHRSHIITHRSPVLSVSQCQNNRYQCGQAWHTHTKPVHSGLHCFHTSPARVADHGQIVQDSETNPDLNSQDPFSLVENDLASLYDDIKEEIQALSSELQNMTHYHFDGKGKAFRPMIVLLMARACNTHQASCSTLHQSQKKVAMIAEMIHTASLVHDDVIDESDTRRGRPSVQQAWGQKQAIITGDYIMSAASGALARLRHIEVVKILSQVLEDLVSGEFMQLGSKEDENERFNHYLRKTYKKTASLIANSCKAVAVLSGCEEHLVEYAFQYGRNIGIAFQLVDDLLDFISSESMMGKPTAADLKLGLATAPVLFAAHQHPELNSMIMRRFSHPGDVQKARDFVSKSDGVSHTRYLAEQHCKEAIRQISKFNESNEKNGLIALTQKVLNRLK